MPSYFRPVVIDYCGQNAPKCGATHILKWKLKNTQYETIQQSGEPLVDL